MQSGTSILVPNNNNVFIPILPDKLHYTLFTVPSTQYPDTKRKKDAQPKEFELSEISDETQS